MSNLVEKFLFQSVIPDGVKRSSGIFNKDSGISHSSKTGMTEVKEISNPHVTFRNYLSFPDSMHQMNLLEDHSLMMKVKEGEVEKLNLLYKRYSRRFFGFFYGMTNDGATSEDLVQNVFMRILKYKHTYKESGDFEVWAFQMARNVHHDHYRKNKRYAFQEDMNPYEERLSETKNQEVEMERSDELNYLKKALANLSDEKRELIELVRFQKVKYAKVAEMLGVTESAIKVRVHRILKELRESYIKMDV